MHNYGGDSPPSTIISPQEGYIYRLENYRAFKKHSWGKGSLLSIAAACLPRAHTNLFLDSSHELETPSILLGKTVFCLAAALR